MEDIFEGAKLGDKFRTRDGKKALYLYGDRCWIEGKSDWTQYYSNGNYFLSGRPNKYDIVGKWQEPIDEEKLDDLAYDYNEERQSNYWWEDDCTVCVCEASEVRKAYEAGYKAAKKGE